jgi:cell division protein ZapA (FtsZ GTPase activity inhibitor)
LPVEFRIGQYGNGFLLGDSGYPCRPFLLTPLLHPANASQEAYNRAHILTRNTIERFFGVLKRRFPCLALGLRCQLNTVLLIIVASGVLHNICKLQNDILDIEENIELDEEDEDEDVAENNAREENEQNPNYAVRNALIATVFAR